MGRILPCSESVLQAVVFCAAILSIPMHLRRRIWRQQKLSNNLHALPQRRQGREPDIYGLTLNLMASSAEGGFGAGVRVFRRTAESGIVWDEALIDKFITAPKKLFPAPGWNCLGWKM